MGAGLIPPARGRYYRGERPDPSLRDGSRLGAQSPSPIGRFTADNILKVWRFGLPLNHHLILLYACS